MPGAPFSDDLVPKSAKDALTQRHLYAPSLESEAPFTVAKVMHLIIGRALNNLKAQIAAPGKAFEESGGFSDRLHIRPLEARAGPRKEILGDAPLLLTARGQSRSEREGGGGTR